MSCAFGTCDPNLPVAGVFAWPCGSDSDERFPYVERCDTCDVFEDDLAAAQAIATAVDGVVVMALRHGRANAWQPAVYPWPKEGATHG